VLSDVNMPVVDGFGLAQRLKGDTRFAATPIVLLTSADRAGDIDRCRDLGVSGHLLKPVRQSALLSAVLRAVGRPAPGEVTAEPEPPARRARRPLDVLLAEDNDINQVMVVNLLEKWGHRVVLARDGREALATLERQRFDVALMDVQMPEMDGFEVTAAVRQKERAGGGRLRIIATTAHAIQGDRERCLAAGMDAYLAKPVRPAELFAALEEGDLRAVLDRDGLLRYVDGDPELLQRVVGRFRKNGPALVSAARDAVARADAPALLFAAHKLKGALGALQAPRALAAAGRLEGLARANSLAGASAALIELEDAVEDLRPALAALDPVVQPADARA
jgi:CheY-like chemotaxis protein